MRELPRATDVIRGVRRRIRSALGVFARSKQGLVPPPLARWAHSDALGRTPAVRGVGRFWPVKFGLVESKVPGLERFLSL